MFDCKTALFGIIPVLNKQILCWDETEPLDESRIRWKLHHILRNARPVAS